MRLTVEQISELERVSREFGVDRNLFVCAISKVGIDVVLNCIDACDYYWDIRKATKSDCSYKDKLEILLKDNGFDWLMYGLQEKAQTRIC